MITRGIIYLATNTLPEVVLESIFSLLPLGRHLLPLSTHNRNQPIDSNEHFFSGLHPAKLLLPDMECLLLLLDFVLIH